MEPAQMIDSRTPPVETDLFFYDGECGFCHHTVRFLIREDPDGKAFRFAPLHGETFLARIPEEARVGLPDSLVVQTEAGSLLVASDAVIHMLRRLGGRHRFWANLLALVPRLLREPAYAGFARVRHRFFERPSQACPVLAPELRARFDP